MKEIKVIDNFLPLDEFKKIQDTLTGFSFPWFSSWHLKISDYVFFGMYPKKLFLSS